MAKRVAIGLVVGVVMAATMVSTVTRAAAAPGDQPVPVTPFSGFDPSLTRAPYVTDLTQTSADVTWATNTAAHGALMWGPSAGSCTSSTAPVTVTHQFNVGSPPISEFQSTVMLTGLKPSTTYCYRVLSPSSVDLLGSSNPAQTFTTLATVGATTPLTFAVVGDLGETQYSSGTEFANSLNTDQAAIDSLIGSSNSQFVVTAGDVSYDGGSQTSYGDLQQTGSRVSDMFGPSYWPQLGGLPTFAEVGNHGQNSNSLTIWPESATATASGGTYAFNSYPALPADGTIASSSPDAWYAISTGNVRLYVLDVAWADGNVGTAPGGQYQVEHDVHWTPSSPEYQWLQADLASHPGTVKMAVFHFPLRSANSSQSSDTYLQNSTANPTDPSSSLEALLAGGGVRLVFNGHAHTYQRIIPGPGQIPNYVTGGGGGILEPVDSCTGLGSVFALGWSPSGAGPTSGSGSSCGTTAPQSAADVYNFLKVTVSGSSITVDPINAAGQTFDPQTYGPPTAGPSTPGSVSALAKSSTSIQVSWGPSTELAPGTISSYQVFRNGGKTPLATVPGSTSTYVDATALPSTTYAYEIVAVDNSNAHSTPGVSKAVATPTMPTGVSAAATSQTSVQLTWKASSETGGKIQNYQINRDGTPINTIPATVGTACGCSTIDTTAQPGTTYTYTVTALDSIGGQSTPATSNPVTTPASLPFTGPPLLGPVQTNCMAHLPAGSVVGSVALNDGSGYYEVDSSGDVAAFGGAVCYGAMTGTHLNLPIVGMAVDLATGGYWLVASDGGIFSFNAPFFGSTGNLRLNKPIVGMGLDRATGGYWLVATDGGVFSFNAPFYGSTGNLILNKPIVGMAPLSNGSGYRLVASDGGVFDFNAPFYGSTGNIKLNRPVIAGLDDNSGDGYWLIASDGGVFSYNAPFFGSAA